MGDAPDDDFWIGPSAPGDTESESDGTGESRRRLAAYDVCGRRGATVTACVTPQTSRERSWKTRVRARRGMGRGRDGACR